MREQLEDYKNQILGSPELENAIYWCDFIFDEDVNVEDNILICNGKSNYKIYPFGKDSCGSNFVILDDKYIGFTSSEGECGIIANNITDFFNILVVCKGFQSYFKKGVFDNIENFINKFKQANNDFDDSLISYGEYPYTNLINTMEKFIKENNFETDIPVLYDRFKSAIITEPSFIIECSDSNSNWCWFDLFGTEQEYIQELKNNK